MAASRSLLQSIAVHCSFWAAFAVTIVKHGTIDTQTLDRADAANISANLPLQQDIGRHFEAAGSSRTWRS